MLTIKEQLLSELDKLSDQQQRELLVLARALQHQPQPLPPGTPGEVLFARAREINFPKEDLAEMMQAIEEDCS